MEIKNEDYHISYDNKTMTINCEGALRLGGITEYVPIAELFNQVLDTEPHLITFDMRQLQFLNSSGINVLSKFVIKVRQKKTVQMIVQGSEQIPWQNKSLKNLKRLMPSLQLEWV
ncbi:hypothetical protein QUF74_10425 [Candidatus Halobeggiatoa sp. HSG11]|nr:hypothetical protein [Candidatus Halobeggiatoa sp. HSG11]